MGALRIALNVGSLICVAAIGWLLVRIILGLLNPESLYAPEVIVPPVSTPLQAGVTKSYDFSTDPFTREEVVAEVAELRSDAPETTLNLSLQGSTTQSSVIMEMPSGEQKNLRIGEDVMNGVSLRAIGKDFVTLDVNGEVQRLTLERVKIELKSGPVITSRPPAPVVLNAPRRAEMEKLFAQVNIIPALDRSGKRQGFKVEPKTGADLSVLGLQEGDILTRIGPVLLGRNQTNIAELRDLISTGAAQDFEVIRDGSPVTIRIGQ